MNAHGAVDVAYQSQPNQGEAANAHAAESLSENQPTHQELASGRHVLQESDRSVGQTSSRVSEEHQGNHGHDAGPGEEEVDLRRDPVQKTVKQQTKTRLPVDTDTALWEKLRDHRRELAEEQGLPPYVVFHDRTLLEMCEALPRTMAEFSRLSGVGARKLDKYGEGFLQVIGAHLEG